MMPPTEEGMKLQQLLSAVRSFHRDLSALLAATDDFMGQAGWEPYNNTAWSDVSAQARLPDGWMPREVFRAYVNEASHALAFFSVLLIPRTSDKDQVEFPEPLATVAWFDYGDEAPGQRWDWWYARWHSYFENTPHGVWTSEPADAKQKFQAARSLGLPLVEVTSAEILHTRLLEPLLKDIKERTAGPRPPAP